MKIRRAEEKDIGRIGTLLYQVQKVHADARPDLFCQGGKKYDDEALRGLLRDDQRPIFVAVDESDRVLGYAFCIYEEPGKGSRHDVKTLYIDDLCVDEACRGQHIGSALYAYVVETARENGCYRITLNVWCLNEPAMRFYQKCGLSPLKVMMEKVL